MTFSDFGLIDFLIVFARKKKILIGLPLLAMILAAALSYLIPNVYRASAKILPPQQAQSGAAAAVLAQLGGVGGGAAGVAGIKNPNDLYIGMLRSRSIGDVLIGKFDLKRAYGIDSTEKARGILEENTNIVAGKDGLITVEVEDEDRQRVAKIANAYIDELVRLTHTLAVTEAAQRRMFFERQLGATKDNLAKAEMELKKTLETGGVISVDSDSRASVEMVSRLRAQITAKQIQINAMQAFVTTNSQEYKRAEGELISLSAELNRLENGGPATRGGAAQTPVGLQNIKVLREVKYHQMLYELLSKQYEVARLDEAKDNSLIQVLDGAVEPERKIKPRRSVLVIVAGLIAWFLAVAYVLLGNARQRIETSVEGKAKLQELRGLIWRK